jgi:adenosylmethionine---8-amino-7-oxononanoate aminotransferase
LKKIFYSDNGSTAVEVALKMAYQYWQNIGQERHKFIGFSNGYHGDTLGAMSIGGSSPFWQRYRHIMADFDSVPFPAITADRSDLSTCEDATICQLGELVERCPEEYAAIFIEPLVQGVGGMNMCSERFLRKLEKFCKERQVLLIYDEVMTGFGRTGEWFAATKSGTAPDIICLSKGITGGFLPLAVTACKDFIFDSFLSEDAQNMFCHGHSYTANPLACAAAVKSIELLESDSTGFRDMERKHRLNSEKFLQEIKPIKNLRFCGTIMAFEFDNGDGNHYYNEISPLLRERFLAKGLLIRPLGNTIYLMPPYCVNESVLAYIYENMSTVLKDL